MLWKMETVVVSASGLFSLPAELSFAQLASSDVEFPCWCGWKFSVITCLHKLKLGVKCTAHDPHPYYVHHSLVSGWIWICCRREILTVSEVSGKILVWHVFSVDYLGFQFIFRRDENIKWNETKAWKFFKSSNILKLSSCHAVCWVLCYLVYIQKHYATFELISIFKCSKVSLNKETFVQCKLHKSDLKVINGIKYSNPPVLCLFRPFACFLKVKLTSKSTISEKSLTVEYSTSIIFISFWFCFSFCLYFSLMLSFFISFTSSEGTHIKHKLIMSNFLLISILRHKAREKWWVDTQVGESFDSPS